MLTPRLKNDTVKVGQLVADHSAGRIVIPEFQRDYVWPKKKAPRLIDSLYHNFPISSLLLWQNSEYAQPRSRTPKPSGTRMSWLIDGQQRVTTLYRVMTGDEGIDVMFNAANEQFALANAAIRHDPSWVRVADLFDDIRYRELRRDISATQRGIALEAKYDRVRAIRDYEVPIVQMIDHTFEDAVDAFTRINSLGVRLKTQDIENAKVAARHSGLIADEVIPFMAQVESAGLRRLTVMHLFRVCAFIAQPDARTRTPLHELPRPDVVRAWKSTEKATMAASQLIKAELGLVNMDILWSGALLVPVIATLATTRPGKGDPRGMVGWLALASMLHRYSRSSETALDQDLKACRSEDAVGELLKNLRQQRRSLTATIADFAGSLNDRSGLLAAYIACKHRNMKDIFTGQTIGMQDNIDRHHILPRRQFEESLRATADNVANIAFITSEVNKSISHSGPEVYLEDVKPNYLESQCIPSDSSLWRIKRADEFFDARRELLAESFNDFVRASLPNRRL
jgi:hypothetical protein